MGLASLTIQHLDDATKARLRSRAQQHGRSVEDEARDSETCRCRRQADACPGNLTDRIRELVEPFGGFEIPEISRKRVVPREPPTFD